MEEEVEQLTHRLKTLEADRYLMKQTIDSLRRENGEMKLIQEIAQQSRELRGLEQKEIQSMSFPPQTLQFQVSIPASYISCLVSLVPSLITSHVQIR